MQDFWAKVVEFTAEVKRILEKLISRRWFLVSKKSLEFLSIIHLARQRVKSRRSDIDK